MSINLFSINFVVISNKKAMKIIFRFFFFLLIFINGLNAQNINYNFFTISDNCNDEAKTAIITSDGGYLIGGWTNSYNTDDYDIYLIKLSGKNNIEWSITIGGTEHEAANSIKQTNDGGYVIAGYTNSYGFGSFDVYIVKIDKNGNIEWTRVIGGDKDDRANDIAQTDDGGYLIAGTTYSYGGGYSDIYIIKLNNLGEIMWEKTIGGKGYDGANIIINSNEGGYLVGGYTSSYGSGGEDIYLIKISNLGDLEWTRTIGGNGDENAYDIIQNDDNDYILVGHTTSYIEYEDDFYIVKMDDNGNVKWTKSIGGIEHENAISILEVNDGGFIIVGSTFTYGAGLHDFYVTKINSYAEVEWIKCFGTDKNDKAATIIKTNYDNFLIIGNTETKNYDKDILIIQIDKNGNGCCDSESGGEIKVGGVGSGGTIKDVISQTTTGGNISNVNSSKKEICQ